MQTSSEQNRVIIGALILICSVCVTIALIYTRAFLIPFVLAIFLSYLLSPLIYFLKDNYKFPRWLAVLTSFFLIGLFFVVTVPFVVESITKFVNSLDQYQSRLVNLAEWAVSIPKHFNIDLGQDIIIETIQNLPILDWAGSLVGSAANIVSTTFLVLIFLFFMLLGTRSDQEKTGIWMDIDVKIRHYLVTKLFTSISTGILVGFILWLFGLELAVVFGVLAFLLNFIPNIGSIISTFLPLPIALLQFSNPLIIFAVILGPGIVQMIIGNIIEPTVMGEGLDLHPVTILCALIFWGLIWGLTGMLLAAPITAILKIVCDKFSITKPVAEVLAGRIY